MAQDESKRYYSTPALEKGLDILELFAANPEGFNVSDVARRLNRTVSEIFRMILCLEKRGYLAQVDSPESTGFYVKVGSKVDLMRAATGHVILSHLTPEARDRAIQEWAQETKETKQKKPADLEAHLTKIRKLGHERRASYEVKGVVNISFPVLNAQGDAVAGLTIPYVKRLHDTISIDKVVSTLRIASQQISEALGAEPSKKPAAIKTKEKTQPPTPKSR
jgi:DNA-binding IclR family transcriptional regulator